MNAKTRPILELLVWAALTFAVLQLHNIPGYYEGPFCGPWG